jgi:hypothetical protein
MAVCPAVHVSQQKTQNGAAGYLYHLTAQLASLDVSTQVGRRWRGLFWVSSGRGVCRSSNLPAAAAAPPPPQLSVSVALQVRVWFEAIAMRTTRNGSGLVARQCPSRMLQHR